MIRPDVYFIESIGEGSLSVMAKPVAGEWIEDEFTGIASLGITRVISLLEKHEEYSLGLEQESELCAKNAMAFLSYPIPDRGLPNSMNEYLQLARKIHNDINRGSQVVIHCRAGIGRTGMVAAGVLLHNGYQPQTALARISEKRGVSVPDTDQQIDWVVKSYARINEC